MDLGVFVCKIKSSRIFVLWHEILEMYFELNICLSICHTYVYLFQHPGCNSRKSKSILASAIEVAF